MEEDTEHPEEARMDEDGGAVNWDQSLLRLARTLPPDLRHSVEDLLRLFAQNGVADAAASRAVFELFQPAPSDNGTETHAPPRSRHESCAGRHL